MTKVRVHELAKEIGKQTKEVIKILEDKGVNGLSALSAVSDEDAAYVKRKSNPQPATKPAEEKNAQKQNGGKKISQVYHPQNSETPKKRIWTNKPQQDKNTNNSNRNGDNRNGQNRSQNGNRPFNRNNDNRNGDRPYNRNNDNRNGDRPYGRNNDNRNGDRPYNRNNDNRNGDRPYNRNNDNRNGDRPYNRDNRNGDNRGGDNRNGRNFNRNNDNRNGNRSFNRNNDNRNGDNRNGQNRSQNGNRPFNRNNDNRFKRDKEVDTVAQDGIMAEKAKKEREDKLRFDKAERNKNSYSDGKKTKKGEKLPVLQKPTREVKEKPEETIKTISLPETVTIKELADKMKLQPSVLVKKLFLQGQIVTPNTELAFEAAEEIALEYDIICEKEEKVDVIQELLKEDEEDEKDMVPRPPVVCVMGHVDHGKTSLLDAIRKTNVISGEAGGITQHIGAYTVKVKGRQITFLDTPGHEAFTSMRMRGAQSTDIAILVVAADDGVMPQTVEAINHAKAAGIEIIVAVNKIDKPAANIDKVKQELAEYELIAEDWGGSTVFVPVSAHTGEGLDELLDMILLQADVMELKANPNRKARGLVLEAKLDKGKGSVANVLVQKGTLHVGDAISAGSTHGRVRAMVDDKGRKIKQAGPSTPVEVLGLNGVPNAGEICIAADSEKEARSFAETFISESREKMLEGNKMRMSLDDLYSQIKAGDVKELNIVVKADVQGSVEAVKQSLTKLSNDEVMVKVIHAGVGAITESDAILASASNAIIIGFNVRPDNQAKEVAEKENVDIRLYRVIYQAIEDVEAAMKGMLDPVYEEKVIGHAEIRQLFKASGVGMIAGSYVLDGMFQRGCSVRITREGKQIFEGPLASLKRFKDDVKEVKAGYECGLVFENFNDIQELDIVEAYIMVEVPR